MRPTSLAAALAAATLLVACESADSASTPYSVDGLDLVTPAYGHLPDGVDLDAEFEALFCPDDPVVTLELALIDRVRDAFAAHGTTYDEGDNPFSIRYAVYNLRNADVVEHLVAAHEEGVDVQLLVEADQLDEARTWNWADEYLVEHGFEFVPDHRSITDDEIVTADLVGIDDPSGLMHLKARLYATPGGTTLLTGSMNPGDNAVLNDETLHLINDPRIVERYAGVYDAVLANAGLHNTFDEAEAVNVLFAPADSGPRAVTQLLQWLSEEDEQILLMVYSLRDLTAPGIAGSLADILRERVGAGVPVYAITDLKQSDGYWDTTEDTLRDAGVHVWEVSNLSTEFTAMHHKVAVLGRTDIRVVTDAGNWSKAAMGSSSEVASNVESVLFVDSAQLDDDRTGQRYLAQWMRVLHKYDHYGEGDGEPSFAEVHEVLTALFGWPVTDVDFGAEQTFTAWGENVYVRGDLDELGEWGLQHDGVVLKTDEFTYPDWSTDVPVAIPAGTPFEWKIVAGYGGTDVRWETGDNRYGFAQPPALVDCAAEASGSWRW